MEKYSLQSTKFKYSKALREAEGKYSLFIPFVYTSNKHHFVLFSPTNLHIQFYCGNISIKILVLLNSFLFSSLLFYNYIYFRFYSSFIYLFISDFLIIEVAIIFCHSWTKTSDIAFPFCVKAMSITVRRFLINGIQISFTPPVVHYINRISKIIVGCSVKDSTENRYWFYLYFQ